MADPELVRRLADSRFLSPADLGQEPVWELGRYVVLHDLGKGASSEVLLARDPLLGREVAIKLLKAVANPTRFSQEMKLLAALDHPHVVKIYDGGLHEGRPFFVMEYLGAHTLESAELSLERTVTLLEQVARACHHAHGLGVVHRDLKPANILVAEDGRAVVADFGIAKLLDRPGHTQPGVIVGTLAYMAPEQLAGGERIGPAVDVYALGAMLYERLCGRLPYEAKDAQTFITMLACGAPIQPPGEVAPGVPPALESVALRALAHDPEDRFTSAGELADALAAWRTGAQAAPAASAASPAVSSASSASAQAPPVDPAAADRAPASSEWVRLVAVIALPLALAVIGVAFVLKGAPRSARPAATPERSARSAAPSPEATSSAATTPEASPAARPAARNPKPTATRAPAPDPTAARARAEVARGLRLMRSIQANEAASLVTTLRDAAVAFARAVTLGERSVETQLLLGRCCRLLSPMVGLGREVDAEDRRILGEALATAAPHMTDAPIAARCARAAVTALSAFCGGGDPSPDLKATLDAVTRDQPSLAEGWLSKAQLHLLSLMRRVPSWSEPDWLELQRCRRKVEELDPSAVELPGLRQVSRGLAKLRLKLRGGR